MRARLQAAKPADTVWDAKNGPGRLMDIELLAQMAALLTGSAARRVEAQLAAGRRGAILSEAEEGVLLDAYRLCWRLQAGTRLLTAGTLDPGQIGEGARAFLLRETGEAQIASLGQHLEKAVARAAEVIAARVA
jgi:glutamate-ammonia-ligase adenylyltransferase